MYLDEISVFSESLNQAFFTFIAGISADQYGSGVIEKSGEQIFHVAELSLIQKEESIESLRVGAKKKLRIESYHIMVVGIE